MPVPDLIGRYRLGQRLGSGGFAVVWLAHDESLDTWIAIKIMADNLADRMDLRERFLTEARMLRRASSNRVVQVFDIGELPDGRPYFVMEYADRGTLSDRVKAGQLPLVDALRMTAEVSRGAAELHRAGIVHRDLKPSNVLITSTPDGGERLMVADLGVAKNLAQASGLTMSVGSAGYMAPEQSGPNSGVDVRADVYSLGAIGYRLITGEHPALPGYVLSDRTTADLPAPVRKVLARALEVDREKRWPDALSLAVELDALADTYSAQPPTARKSRRWTVAALVTVATLLVAAGAGYAIGQYRRPVIKQDSTGTISSEVPRSWKYSSQGGWDPKVLSLESGHQAGLLVTDRASGWNDLSQRVNGVFIGLTSDDAKLSGVVKKITHPDCGKPTVNDYQHGEWTGVVSHWDNCKGPGYALMEVSLSRTQPEPEQVYLQLRRDDATSYATAVDAVVDGLKITPQN
jgi:serine/threonine protein kinase